MNIQDQRAHQSHAAPPYRGYPQHPVPPPLYMNGIPPPVQRLPQQPAMPGSILPIPNAASQTVPAPTGGQSFSGHFDGKVWSLEVVQQPVRARMCGFGDKDRRPITPPPCIRLVVRDEKTNREIDINELDTTFYLISVDLAAEDGMKEVNIVRHSASSPSISAAACSEYPPPPPTAAAFPFGMPMAMSGMHHAPPQNYAMPSQFYGQQPGMSHPQGGYHPGYPPQQAYYNPMPGQQMPVYSASAGALTPHYPMMVPQDPRASPNGMCTRNLIGQLCVSAFKLTNCEGELGIWFILQDLSVRTEGSFRLRINFVNVANRDSPLSINHTNAPVRASIFSDVFQVFSAKKFPGVIESTPLSKCFATQGIKIPIRKDGPQRKVEEDEE